MFICVYSVFVLSCLQVVSLRGADPQSTQYTDCVKDRAPGKVAKVQQRTVEPWIESNDSRSNSLTTRTRHLCITVLSNVGAVL
jgi:hypothetical protein